MDNDASPSDRRQWVAIEIDLFDHPKILRVGALGGWAHLRAIAYCARHRTDGFIPDQAVWQILHDDPDMDEASDDLASSMCQAKLWHREANGYRVHDYLKYQSNALTIRDKRVEAGRLGGLKSASVRRKQTGKQTSSKPQATKLDVDVDVDVERTTPSKEGGSSREKPKTQCPRCGIVLSGELKLAEHLYLTHDGPEPEHWLEAEARAEL